MLPCAMCVTVGLGIFFLASCNYGCTAGNWRWWQQQQNGGAVQPNGGLLCFGEQQQPHKFCGHITHADPLLVVRVGVGS